MDFSSGITPEDVQVFLEEADEQIQLLEDDLVRLEREDHSDELLQEIFRAAHTLKGSSATLGHQKMAELTHAMENVFDQLRRGAVRVSTALMDVLLEAIDALSAMKDDIRAGADSDVDITPLTAAIAEALEASAGGQQSTDQQSTEQPPLDRAPDGANEAEELVAAASELAVVDDTESLVGESVVRLSIAIDPECPMPSVRAYQVVDLLASLGVIVQSVPSIDEIEAGHVDYSLVVAVETDRSSAELLEMVQQVTDLSQVRVVQSTTDSSSDRASAPADGTAPVGDLTVQAQSGQSEPTEAESPKAVERSHQAKRSSTSVSTTVRVDVAKLDTLMNLVAELVIDRAHLVQIAKDLETRYDRSEISEALDRTSLNVGRATSELQDEIMKIRMLPIDNVFRKFPRMVRDLTQKLGKEVNFVIEGQDTELDRSVIEEIGDPLIHLLRNAVGHGIESPEERLKAGKPRQGFVRIRAYHQENSIVIEVEDDGQGIDVERVRAKAVEKGIVSAEAASRMTDREAINLIFAPGLSTAKTIDSVSGRGVGMDIVRNNIERLNGSISVETAKGAGTRFVVKLPLTLAIIRAQLVSVGGRIYAIPISSVQINLREPESSIKTVRGQETYVYGDRVLPIVRLSKVFGVREISSGDGRLLIVVVRSSDEQIGLVVDKLMGQQEIVIKNLGGVLGDIHGLSGVTILGDGRLALIIDVPSLIRSVSTREYCV
jgi:two-component system chemotaxis sensor kinase CheA